MDFKDNILMLDGQDFEIYGAFDEDKDGIHEYAEYISVHCGYTMT